MVTEAQRRAIEAYERAGTVRGAARLLGMEYAGVRRALIRSGAYTPNPLAPVAAPAAGQRVRSTATLLRPDEGDPRAVLQWVRTAYDEPDLAAAVTEACAGIAGGAGVSEPVALTDADMMVVVPLGDPHVGMLSWEPETGGRWDLKETERVLVGAVAHAVRQAPNAARCLLINLGDYYHADDSTARTPASHHALDVDSRHPHVIAVGLYIIRRMVELCLSRFGEVHIDNVRGNHDPHSAIALDVFLRAWFRDDPRVIIHDDPTSYRFHRWGDCLIGTHHGHKRSRASDLHRIMSVRASEAWGQTRNDCRRWYVGHVHHDSSADTGGCVVETHATLAPRDAYAAHAGYDASRNLKLDVWHRSYGLVERHVMSLRRMGL